MQFNRYYYKKIGNKIRNLLTNLWVTLETRNEVFMVINNSKLLLKGIHVSTDKTKPQ